MVLTRTGNSSPNHVTVSLISATDDWMTCCEYRFRFVGTDREMYTDLKTAGPRYILPDRVLDTLRAVQACVSMCASMCMSMCVFENREKEK